MLLLDSSISDHPIASSRGIGQASSVVHNLGILSWLEGWIFDISISGILSVRGNRSMGYNIHGFTIHVIPRTLTLSHIKPLLASGGTRRG